MTHAVNTLYVLFESHDSCSEHTTVTTRSLQVFSYSSFFAITSKWSQFPTRYEVAELPANETLKLLHFLELTSEDSGKRFYKQKTFR